MAKSSAKTSGKALISVVIPAFNEEGNVYRAYNSVVELFETTLAGKYDFEIVFTDNHSTDKTFAELESLAESDKRVRAVRFSRNFGFNNSLITGYRLAKGDAAVQLDCDLQDPPSLIAEFLKLWEEGHDVVVGVRVERDEPRWLKLGRKLFYRLVARISDDDLVVDGGDFRLVDRTILDRLRAVGEASPYVRGLVSVLAANQIGVPYNRSNRVHGQSKFPLGKLMGLAVDGIVNHSTIPLRLAAILGFLVATATLLLAGYYGLMRLVFGFDWPAGFATTVILELLSMSLNAVLLGIIGEYIGKIHMQLKSRPTTIIQKSINI